MKRLWANPLLDRISLPAKTRILVGMMIAGILLVGGFSHLQFYTIKHDYEVLYAHHTVSVVKLEWIKEIYAINVLDTLRDMERKTIDRRQGESVIKLARELIGQYWQEYQEQTRPPRTGWIIGWTHAQLGRLFPKRTLESKAESTVLASQTAERIKRVDALLEAIFAQLSQGHRDEAVLLIQDHLYPAVKSAETHLGQLVHLHLDTAIEERRRSEAISALTSKAIIGLIATVVLFALLLSLAIARNIQRLHHKLEEKVEEKTKELRTLNEQLERRIAKEVRNSQEKDRIMYQQSRLAAMGEMIANIAHQWRQPLNALSVLIQGFQAKQMLGRLDSEFVERQSTEGLRIARQMSETIENFRNFFQPSRKKEMFNAVYGVREAIGLIENYFLQNGITITLKIRSDLCLEGFSNEFSQVVLNLLSNARDALTANQAGDRHILVLIASRHENDRSWAIVNVVDNGGGVPEKIIDRIFDPYFTTKHPSHGTGIGLYMSKQIIEQQMGGRLSVKNIWHKMGNSKLQPCALFTLELPAKKRRDCGCLATKKDDPALCGRRGGCTTTDCADPA